MNISHLTNVILYELGGYDAVSSPIPDSSGRHINPDFVDKLTDVIHELIADLCATLIDAGSERDAVLENDRLHEIIRTEFADWSTLGGN